MQELVFWYVVVSQMYPFENFSYSLQCLLVPLSVIKKKHYRRLLSLSRKWTICVSSLFYENLAQKTAHYYEFFSLIVGVLLSTKIRLWYHDGLQDLQRIQVERYQRKKTITTPFKHVRYLFSFFLFQKSKIICSAQFWPKIDLIWEIGLDCRSIWYYGVGITSSQISGVPNYDGGRAEELKSQKLFLFKPING